jgi:two-component system, sensor histidine kinase PhcS
MLALLHAQRLSEEASEHRHLLFYSRVTCVVAMVLVLMGVGLDAAFYPERATTFGLLRGATAGAIGLILLSYATPFGQRHIRRLTYLWIALPQVMIAWMIFATDGEASIYFVGLTFGIAGIGIFLPLTVREACGYSVFTIAIYVVACVAREGGVQRWDQLLGQTIFLSFYGVIAVTVAVYGGRWRRQTLALQNEVIRQRDELIESNQALTQIKGQLLHREKMAAIGTLSAGLLHELNNPVNFSLMALDMGRTQPAVGQDAMLRESLDDAREGLVRIQNIVTDLKTFAYQKPDGGNVRPFLFENAARSAVRLAGFDLKGIEVRLELPQDTHVLGDEPGLIGVMINLLSNAAHAVRAAKRERPEVVVAAVVQGERMAITVRDNGQGIEPQNLERVFDPFFTTRDVGSGLGLGLSISYGIVQRHGGHLTVRSEPGAWTEFHFDLPRPT